VLERGLGADHVSGVEAGIESVEPGERAHEESRADQQDQAEGDFASDQSVARPAAARAGDATAAFDPDGAGMDAAGLNGGGEPERESGGHGDREHDEDDAKVEGDGVPGLDVGRAEVLEPGEGFHAYGDAEGATAERQQEALREELADDCRAS